GVGGGGTHRIHGGPERRAKGCQRLGAVPRGRWGPPRPKQDEDRRHGDHDRRGRERRRQAERDARRKEQETEKDENPGAGHVSHLKHEARMSSSPNPMATWGALLARGRSRLSGAEHAPYEAEELLARAAARPRAWFHGRRSELADASSGVAFEALVARRAAGEPLQYLLGEWEFLGRAFLVDPRALIPAGGTGGSVEGGAAAGPP